MSLRYSKPSVAQCLYNIAGNTQALVRRRCVSRNWFYTLSKTDNIHYDQIVSMQLVAHCVKAQHVDYLAQFSKIALQYHDSKQVLSLNHSSVPRVYSWSLNTIIILFIINAIYLFIFVPNAQNYLLIRVVSEKTEKYSRYTRVKVLIVPQYSHGSQRARQGEISKEFKNILIIYIMLLYQVHNCRYTRHNIVQDIRKKSPRKKVREKRSE